MPVQRLHAVSHIDLFGARYIRDAAKTRLRQANLARAFTVDRPRSVTAGVFRPSRAQGRPELADACGASAECAGLRDGYREGRPSASGWARR